MAYILGILVCMNVWSLQTYANECDICKYTNELVMSSGWQEID